MSTAGGDAGCASFLLRPFDPHEALSLKQAAARAGKSTGTMRLWAEVYSIGRRIPRNGPWHVSAPALEMLLSGDTRNLKAYLAGDRSSAVQEYFRQAGVPSPKGRP